MFEVGTPRAVAEEKLRQVREASLATDLGLQRLIEEIRSACSFLAGAEVARRDARATCENARKRFDAALAALNEWGETHGH